MDMVSPTCGKISTMKNHAKSCHWFSEVCFGSLRDDILAKHAKLTGKDKENISAPATHSPISSRDIITPFAPHGQGSTAA